MPENGGEEGIHRQALQGYLVQELCESLSWLLEVRDEEGAVLAVQMKTRSLCSNTFMSSILLLQRAGSVRLAPPGATFCSLAHARRTRRMARRGSQASPIWQK